MDCLEIRKRLLFYVDRELTGEQEREFRLHLEGCSCCQRRAGYEERIRIILRDRLAPPTPPPGLRDRICARLAGESATRPASPSARPVLRPAPAMALLLLSLLLAVSGGVLASRLSSGPPPGGTVRLTGRLICLRCELEGVPPETQRRCSSPGHVTGLKTADGRLLRLTGDGMALLQGDRSLRGRKVEVVGILDPAGGALEVRGHRFPEDPVPPHASASRRPDLPVL